MLPIDLLFDCLGVVNYINIEPRDYTDLGYGHVCSDQYKFDARKRLIFCNAEDISTQLATDQIDPNLFCCLF